MRQRITLAATPAAGSSVNVTKVVDEGGTAAALFIGPFRRLSAADNEFVDTRTARLNGIGSFIYGNLTMGLVDVFWARSRGTPLLEAVIPGGR